MPRWKPSLWAGIVPNGLGQVKPNHYLDMLRVAWRNRDQLPFAWRILSLGVCDGCALGTTGMKDFTLKGVHLCTVRLNLLRLNTMPALKGSKLRDVESLSRLSSAELRDLGRLPYPFVRRKGDRGFRRVSWVDALGLIAERIGATTPDRLAFYLTSRGISNEVYYVAQKAARFLGTNNVDNSARLCHAPSTTALKETLGVGASTCSYKDWLGTDLIVFLGSDVPNNQPVTTKYLYYAKQNGTRVAVVNPFREPGLERYWVPSVFESAVFGTKIADEFFGVHTGGDVAFLNGVLKSLIENGWTDDRFIADHTTGFEEAKAEVEAQSWETIEQSSGASRAEIERLARMYSRAKSAVFVWSMGLTQHRFGVDNVKAVVNVALARGMVGRENCGLMPIRGHSGVQGGSEVGCAPNVLPGGRAIDDESAATFEEMWGFEVPRAEGTNAVEMIDAAAEGRIDVLHSAGGNFLETLPEPEYVREALARIPLRIHQDIVVTSQMLVEPEDTVVLLPAATRYEQEGGATETSTERYIYYSPEIPGRRIGEARPEWRIFMEIAQRVRPDNSERINFSSGAEIREEIARAVRDYAGIELLSKQGDAVQYGGRTLCSDGEFRTADGKARFSALTPPDVDLPDGCYAVSTRRGKQFNSMVWGERDPLTGAVRDDVFMSERDANDLGLRAGDPVVLRSDCGSFRGRVKIAPIRRRNLQVHWPEANQLLRRGIVNEASGIPDYNAIVEVLSENDGGEE
jgi:molybdopterin-dependent oxidoreductase alpha subunit